jgi:hypothetical protein
VPVPGSFEPLSDQDVARVAARTATEYHLFVDEDYGWREWLWFPGLERNEFARWWVSEATAALCGEFFPAYGPLWEHARRAVDDEEQLTLHIDGAHNTYLALHKKYEATLIPRFAWTTADPSSCGAHGATAMDTIKRWWRSIALTRTASPEAYLWAYKSACAEMRFNPEGHPLPEEVRALIELDGDRYLTRDWSGLSALLPIPLFEPGTVFWDVNGEPYWGRFLYQSALRDHTVTERYMRDEGREVSEKEFLFLLSFCPRHRVPGLAPCSSRDGVVPDQLPPTNTYWFFNGSLAAVSRKEFVRLWPGQGLVHAHVVRREGEQISEAEFRRHLARYAAA